MGRIGLTLNETKTRLCDGGREHFDFLGYTFGPERSPRNGRRYLAAKPSKKAVARLKGRVRQVLRSGVVAPWPEVRDHLNRVLRGWSAYFDYGTLSKAYSAVDHHVETNVRNFLQRRHKVPGLGTRRFSASVIFGERGVLRLRWVRQRRTAGADV